MLPELRHAAANSENLSVRLTIHTLHLIRGQGQMATLHVFLQASLRVLAAFAWVDAGEALLVEPEHDALRGPETAIENDRPEDRLERVGEYRRPFPTAAFLFALADPEVPRKIEANSERMKCRLAHEVRPHPGQLSLRQVGKALEQGEGDHAIQHAVADELEPLIVRLAETAVRQSLAQAARFDENVTEGGFETQTGVRRMDVGVRGRTLLVATDCRGVEFEEQAHVASHRNLL